jgi:hypothetical protein
MPVIVISILDDHNYTSPGAIIILSRYCSNLLAEATVIVKDKCIIIFFMKIYSNNIKGGIKVAPRSEEKEILVLCAYLKLGQCILVV